MEPRPQACGTFWYSSCPPPARYKKVKESRPKQSQKTWQDSALWNPNPPAWKKKKKPEYNPLHPGYFCNVSSLFFPGRLDVSESHVLQTTAWQKAVVAFAFCVCQFSAPLTRVTLLVRGSQQTVNSKTKPKKHLQKKTPQNLNVRFSEKRILIYKSKQLILKSFLYTGLLIFHYYFRSSRNLSGKMLRSFERHRPSALPPEWTILTNINQHCFRWRHNSWSQSQWSSLGPKSGNCSRRSPWKM